MIEFIIPEYFSIMFNCGLVHCGTSSWFISRGEYSKNKRVLFTIIEWNFNLTHEITVQKKNQLCTIDKCDLCINDKFATNEDNGPVIDIRNLKNCNAKINEKNKTGKCDIINGNLDLLGWKVSKSSMVMGDVYMTNLLQ